MRNKDEILLESLYFESLENNIFKNVKNIKGIEWFSIDDVMEMSAPIPTPMSKKDYMDLWKSLVQDGMKTPMEITTNGKHMRLDSGNHRIKLFKQNNISKIPCIVKKVKNVVVTPENGLHIGMEIK